MQLNLELNSGLNYSSESHFPNTATDQISIKIDINYMTKIN